QSLKVVMDPRSPATTANLQQQLQLAQQIFAEVTEARRALAEIASVQKQLADVDSKLGEQKSILKSALAGAQSEIAKILTTKEATEQQPQALQDAYTGLASALHVVEGGDRTVPSQAIAVYKESSPRVKDGIAQWTTFKQAKLPELNQKLREAGFAPLTISKID
ncbi:MAG TPA: hypothetical protein VNO32_45830, partial [Candidatus Acidoferrum sp.]|nr:hypothetical protein [Candidatus Acidoferrum sp.]